jgi:ribosomal protein S18 acetylase RimI-like enzyme
MEGCKQKYWRREEMKVEIRRATVADIPIIISFRDALFSPYVSRESVEEMNAFSIGYLEEKIPNGEFICLLAEIGGEVVGSGALTYYQLSPKPGILGEDIGYVSSVFVREDCRRRGIARQLMAEILETARSKGVKFVSLHAGTKEGEPLYESLGFWDTQERMVKL